MKLTPSEAAIFVAVVNADGGLVTWGDLATMQGYAPISDATDHRCIAAHMSNLRAKLPTKESKAIVTVKGHGIYWALGAAAPPIEAQPRTNEVPAELAVAAWKWVEARRA